MIHNYNYNYYMYYMYNYYNYIIGGSEKLEQAERSFLNNDSNLNDSNLNDSNLNDSSSKMNYIFVI